VSVRLVVFDVDGTLIDSQAQIVAAMGHAFAAMSLVCPPREAILSIVGLSLPQAMAELVPEPDVALHAELVRHYRDSFAALRVQENAPLYPGAREALEALAESGAWVLGVATGKSRRGLDHAIAAHGLGGFFRTTQVADDHPSKPHPAMLHAALAEAGADPAQAVMIGDTTYDIAMGRAAGTRTLGVGWGYHPPAALAGAGADRILDSFEALVPALDQLWEPA
jgi:phosphoglycolate phosphatase